MKFGRVSNQETLLKEEEQVRFNEYKQEKGGNVNININNVVNRLNTQEIDENFHVNSKINSNDEEIMDVYF